MRSASDPGCNSRFAPTRTRRSCECLPPRRILALGVRCVEESECLLDSASLAGSAKWLANGMQPMRIGAAPWLDTPEATISWIPRQLEGATFFTLRYIKDHYDGAEIAVPMPSRPVESHRAVIWVRADLCRAVSLM